MDSSKGVKLKLCSHQKQHYKEIELLVNLRDLGPNVKEGDILEIYHPEEDRHQPRLLLQIPHFVENVVVTKDSISVEQNIASAFQLRSYKDVIVNKVDPSAVALELLELTFKDQYLGRADMWRLKRSLINTVTYSNKIIEFCSNSIRCQTYEMWAQGEKVACGVITEDTKVVFRSSTCQAYLFIQMSSEMWEFDNYGDLYFEKAVDGFLAELFAKWEKGSNHDVTIVLFSRTYYKASSWDEFPPFMRECLVQDYQGRFYEDFYRVAVQSERYDEWMPTLSHLRRLFHSYLDDVLKHHSHQQSESDIPIPEAYNSNAAQGNFLEVLNISLNVFEKHYTDRSFERTGQMSVVITPGVGVFEVDRELTNITKQRIIDNGVGSDLVCLAEQPLHAVPLLKFHKKRGSFKAVDYSMPHTWINLSFYSSKKRPSGNSSFVPRIKVPQDILKVTDKRKVPHASFAHVNLNRIPSSNDEHSFPNSVYDYDAHDAQVFKIPASQHNRAYRSLQRPHARKKPSSHSSSSAHQPPRVHLQRKLSDSDLYKSIERMTSAVSSNKMELESCIFGRSPAINIPTKLTEHKMCSHSFGALNIEGVVDKKMSCHSEFDDMSPSIFSKVGSSGANSPNEYHAVSKSATLRTSRSLINPFNPSHVTGKLTSNRRRWIHTFPKGPTGLLIQQHHYQVSSVNLSDEEDEDFSNPLFGEDFEDFKMKLSENGFDRGKVGKRTREKFCIDSGQMSGVSFSSGTGTPSPNKQSQYPHEVQPPPMLGIFHTNPSHTTYSTTAHLQHNRQATLLWGATGEQEWKAEITTGVDWKSLTLPACFPLTTDYFPDKQSLQYDYEVAANYSRVPDSSDNVFLELVSQRLSQGFQLIMRPDDDPGESKAPPTSALMRSRRSKAEEVLEEYKLSIGRVFHLLQSNESSIDVTIYRPKHPYPPLERKYKFRFRSPYLSKYQMSWGEFRTERLESYKWNSLDSYICFRGDPKESSLLEDFKYWRFRLMVVPDHFKTETKKLIETPIGTKTPCDIYHPLTIDEQQNTIDNFIRFLEVVHRIRKPGTCKKSWVPRERLGSVRTGDRPLRPRTYTKASDRVRYESGNKEKDEIARMHNDFDDETKDESDLKKLNRTMSLTTVVEFMKESNHGLPFISSTNSTVSLPSNTFISHDATIWVLKRFEDIHNQIVAVEYLQKLLDEDIIRHASGSNRKPFINGFYLYSFTADVEKKNSDILAFETDWFEIRVDPLLSLWMDDEVTGKRPPLTPPSTSQDFAQDEDGMYRSGYFELDGKVRSDRYEWGHLKYQKEFKSIHAFDFILEWMCATGPLVNELILMWQRKASNHCLHLFPVPTEPFVLPFTFNSNPLRSSIVIPLKIEALKPFEKDPLAEYDYQTLVNRMEWFQESILEKFGFLRYITVEMGETKTSFVHVTGNMIVLIGPHGGQLSGGRPRSVSLGSPREQEERRASDPQESNGSKSHVSLQPCFLWSFNYMLTKRWKSSSSGDEILGERILKDFREFCSDQDQRLSIFWNSLSGLSHVQSYSAPNFVDVCMQ